MVKWVRITKTYWFGLFAFGFVLVLLQQLPYLIMPLIPLAHNPLMEMVDKIVLLNLSEKIIGISCVLLTLFLVRENNQQLPLKTRRQKLCFTAALVCLALYYIGWGFYFTGRQTLIIMLGILVTMPPLFYAFIGLWRQLTPLAILGFVFLFVHMANVSVNLLT
ncbi:MAG: hypothetical protein LBR25_09480 [Erysipelotrichaceae bacterium]|nr:hypothetical protein [Erysipelotrichaceae bacterium]